MAYMTEKSRVDITLPDNVNHRTILHKLILYATGRNYDDAASMLEFEDDSVICDFLSRVPLEIAQALVRSRDSWNKTPLHYTALYGLPRIAGSILSYVTGSVKGREWRDDDDHSPLYYAIMKGCVSVVAILIDLADAH